MWRGDENLPQRQRHQRERERAPEDSPDDGGDEGRAGERVGVGAAWTRQVEQIVADVVERVGAGEGREKSQQRAPQERRAELCHEPESDRAAGGEEQRESVAHVEQRDERAPGGERDERPAAFLRSGGDEEQHAARDRRTDIARAGDDDRAQERRRVAGERQAGFVGADHDAIDRAADEQRGRGVTALVHQHDQEPEGIERPGVPEDDPEDGRRRESEQQLAVEMMLRLHAVTVTLDRCGCFNGRPPRRRKAAHHGRLAAARAGRAGARREIRAGRHAGGVRARSGLRRQVRRAGRRLRGARAGGRARTSALARAQPRGGAALRSRQRARLRGARGALRANGPQRPLDPRQWLGPEPLARPRFSRRGHAQRRHAWAPGGADARRRARALVQRARAAARGHHCGDAGPSRRTHPSTRRRRPERRPPRQRDGSGPPRDPSPDGARGRGDAAALAAGIDRGRNHFGARRFGRAGDSRRLPAAGGARCAAAAGLRDDRRPARLGAGRGATAVLAQGAAALAVDGARRQARRCSNRTRTSRRTRGCG